MDNLTQSGLARLVGARKETGVHLEIDDNSYPVTTFSVDGHQPLTDDFAPPTRYTYP